MRWFKHVIIPLILALVFLICLSIPLVATDGKTVQQITCDIQNQPCTRDAFGGKVTLDILPRPVKAMENLTFHLVARDIIFEGAPFIDLGMPGMKMGKNRVEMKADPSGSFQGTGIIVRCPSGKTIWQATVHLPGKGSVTFVFDVIY